MANYSSLFAPAPTSPIKSIQTGYINVLMAAMSSGSGEDTRYVDVTIAAVTISKSKVTFVGSAGNNGGEGKISNASSGVTMWVTARLINSTTLRLSVATTNLSGILGRWTVEEYV